MATIATIVSTQAGLPPGLRTVPTKPKAGAAAARPQVAPGWVRIQAEDDEAMAILVELGDSMPDLTGGYNVWDDVDRQRDISLTRWSGSKPATFDIDLWIDGYLSRTSINPILTILDGMAGIGPKSGPGEPPRLIVDTAGVLRVDTSVYPDARWVIADIQWSKDDDASIRAADGTRLRAACTVTMKNHVAAGKLQGSIAFDRHIPAGSKPPYVAKKGDTLVSIAHDKLGDPGRWRELATLNGIRDPGAVKAGQHIKLS